MITLKPYYGTVTLSANSDDPGSFGRSLILVTTVCLDTVIYTGYSQLFLNR